MRKIEHAAHRIKQSDRPICGVCAFLNDLFLETDIISEKKKLKKIRDEIWWEILDKNIDFAELAQSENNEVIITAGDGNLNYSIVGEIFGSTAFKNIFEGKKDNILKLVRKIDPTIKYYTIEKLDSYEEFKNNFVEKDENIFYIFPHNVGRNVHWLCLKVIDNKYYILNSAKNTSDEIKSQNKGIYSKGFKIETLEQIKDAQKNVVVDKRNNRFYPFTDFTSLLSKFNYRKLCYKNKASKKMKQRIKLLKTKKVKYNYIPNDWNFLKIKVER